ncbi:hypothetical protein A5779_20655 [Mycolicibacterium peregrinum]|uniref:ESX-1 secretion-associated protein n=1 Tax=Mycolicibacterium peregrinum TaxID=43304 RepID=A0A1A0WA20_MYCPR|nr:hypothetical protein A5779_20655 [Mycolicibacterium peregrinum]
MTTPQSDANALKVLVDDLNARSAQQRKIADGINAAEHITDGASFAVIRTHGVVCALATSALKEAQMSRTAANQAMNGASTKLAGILDSASAQYSGTDQHQAGKLDGQMPPR